LYASPIYFWSFSAQMKALIDRSYSLAANYGEPGHTSLMKGKRLGLLVTGADAYEDNAEAMFTAFDRIVDYFIAVKAAELYVGNCGEPAELSDDVKQKARALAHNLAE
jgi:multimeric flavodoxin WrbA